VLSGCPKNEATVGQKQSAGTFQEAFLRELLLFGGWTEIRRQRQRANANAQVSRIRISISLTWSAGGYRPQMIKLAFRRTGSARELLLIFVSPPLSLTNTHFARAHYALRAVLGTEAREKYRFSIASAYAPRARSAPSGLVFFIYLHVPCSRSLAPIQIKPVQYTHRNKYCRKLVQCQYYTYARPSVFYNCSFFSVQYDSSQIM